MTPSPVAASSPEPHAATPYANGASGGFSVNLYAAWYDDADVQLTAMFTPEIYHIEYCPYRLGRRLRVRSRTGRRCNNHCDRSQMYSGHGIGYA